VIQTSFEKAFSFGSAVLASDSDANFVRTRKTVPFSVTERSTYDDVNPPSISFAASASAVF